MRRAKRVREDGEGGGKKWKMGGEEYERRRGEYTCHINQQFR